MAQTKIKAGLFEGIIGNGTDGYYLMSNGDGTMTWSSIIINPTIASIDYPGTATAADPAGGESVTITGSNFQTGATVTIGGTAAPSVSYVSGTELTITTPAKTAGDYDIVVTNTDTGSATYVNGISYNGIPSWTTAAGSLGTFASGETISTITLQATEPDAGTITFNITNGALPTGLSLTGANIDGTTSILNANTLYTFTVTATDDENQTTPRTFTITVQKQIVSTDNFNTVLYTGNGGTQSITGVGFQPDLVWVKSRSATNPHVVGDIVRGGRAALFPNLTNAESVSSGNNYIYSFNSDGFSVGGASYAVNNNGQNFVGWCWKAGGAAVSNTDGSITSSVSANTEAGFSICTYTGTGSNTSFGHGLDSAPELVIIKSRDQSTRSWITHFSSLSAGAYMLLNGNNANATSTARINTTTSSVVNIGTSANVNQSSDNLVAYCFHSVTGYQKIGSYTGTGGANTINTGFAPRFLLIKRTDSTGNWRLYDRARDSGSLPTRIDFNLNANLDSAEYNASSETYAYAYFGTNGFYFVAGQSNGDINGNGSSYVYLAIA
jgi:hypothetical protein